MLVLLSTRQALWPVMVLTIEIEVADVAVGTDLDLAKPDSTTPAIPLPGRGRLVVRVLRPDLADLI